MPFWLGEALVPDAAVDYSNFQSGLYLFSKMRGVGCGYVARIAVLARIWVWDEKRIGHGAICLVALSDPPSQSP
jgi:hypothetical protein